MSASPTMLFLTAPEIRDVIEELEGIRVPQRTLAGWLQIGLAKPSVRWDHKRGSAHPCLFNLSDLARLRLITRVLYKSKIRPVKLKLILSYIDKDLAHVFHPKSAAHIAILEDRVFVLSPGETLPVDASAGGQRVLFPIVELLAGNEEAAKKRLAATAA